MRSAGREPTIYGLIDHRPTHYAASIKYLPYAKVVNWEKIRLFPSMSVY